MRTHSWSRRGLRFALIGALVLCAMLVVAALGSPRSTAFAQDGAPTDEPGNGNGNGNGGGNGKGQGQGGGNGGGQGQGGGGQGGGNEQALLNFLEREQRALEHLQKRFEVAQRVHDKVNEWIASEQANGRDTASLAAGLSAFDARIAAAQAAADQAAALLAARAGFNGDGTVADAQTARATLKEVRTLLRTAHHELVKAVPDFRHAVNDYRKANHVPGGDGADDAGDDAGEDAGQGNGNGNGGGNGNGNGNGNGSGDNGADDGGDEDNGSDGGGG